MANVLQILEHSRKLDFVSILTWIPCIKGKIKNNSNYNLSFIKVEISLFDRNDILIGNIMDCGNNLSANGIWEFKAHIPTNVNLRAKKYKIYATFIQ